MVNRTKLNSQGDVLESVRNVYLYGEQLKWVFFSNCSLTSTLLELDKLAFERMLQQELSVKVVLKSSL